MVSYFFTDTIVLETGISILKRVEGLYHHILCNDNGYCIVIKLMVHLNNLDH